MRGLKIVAGTAVTLSLLAMPAGISSSASRPASYDKIAGDNATRMMTEGRNTFRFDTFGDEEFWGDVLGLHRAIEGEQLGGTGPGVSPRTALSVGLKVDMDALGTNLTEKLKHGQINLDDPAVTLSLLKLNAVVGVTGFFDNSGKLRSMGIQCALCHSTVDNSLAPGIGHRLDGWANRDLDVGTIVALAPNLQPFADLLGVTQDQVRDVLRHWGVGKFDAELILDGKTVGPQGSAAVLIPPAFGLAGVNLHTWTGWGSVTYWNAFVANLEMHGKGTFSDARLDDAAKFPIAAANGLGHIRADEDRITPKLAALHFYQLALPAPRPPAGSFDSAAAERGRMVFNGPGQCSTCHVPPLFTEPGWNMHRAAEIGIDDFQASRSPDDAYRTSPLRGLWSHVRGGFFHDGRFATLEAVVGHYDTVRGLGLSEEQKKDLVEYLKSL